MDVPAPDAKVAPPTALPDAFPPGSTFALTPDGEPLSKIGATWLIWDWSIVPPRRGRPSAFMVSNLVPEAEFRAAIEATSQSGSGTLEHAIELAAKAHAGQVDKAGAPYVLHPLRMMLSLDSKAERIVAMLHDVVEDCEGWSLQRLRDEGFSGEVVEAVDAVTNRPGETYEEFVLRAAKNEIGRRVKLADLRDNSDLSRIPNPTGRDHQRIVKYQRAIHSLENFSTLAAATPSPRGEEARQRSLNLSPEVMERAIEQRTAEETEHGKSFGTGNKS